MLQYLEGIRSVESNRDRGENVSFVLGKYYNCNCNVNIVLGNYIEIFMQF